MIFSRENNVRSDGNGNNNCRGLFDQLPDEILLEIFNKVVDAKSLVRCLSVSKRFKSIIPQIDYIFLRLPRHRVSASKTSKLVNNLVRFLQSIATAGKQKNDKRRNALYHSPTEILKGFGELKSLHIELPCSKGAIGVMPGKDSMLKWKAEFGASLESCVILAASSARKDSRTENDTKEYKGNNGQSALNDEDLKKRIVWVISSLIAASARHYLTKRVVSSFPALKNVVVSDNDKRGRVTTRGDKLGESADDVEAESSMERSLIPDLEIKLWYVPRMVLKQSGCVVEGATLVVIRPLDHNAGTKQSNGGDGESLRGVDDGFDGDEDELNIVGEAIREIVKMKKTYVMEMTAF